MAPEYLERIFEPFFSTKPETGVGLGLGVVRKRVLLYGGTVEVRSAVGQGTCFVLTLPRGGARANG
ncbi:HAMP domain-containing sensor histidine kinase [Archangium sp.]|uniref:HAMP domain-containing sensor histidine kinase n=1 Tax=Archangium sp. TaxID=1872627 RepID=UPI00286CD23E|nr:HAMP domain-containing sensor histidine kinase [Archangium sp.]